MAKVGALGKIEIIGKRGGEQPFPIRRQKGLYFFISVKHAEKLQKVNEACKEYKKLKPLKAIKIIGRGSIPGYRPFPLKGKEGLYLCILSEHFRQLKELNDAYKELTQKKKAKGKA
ncbi:MAG: hypothetical protein QME47_05310 [Candidatus Thermoplasmatota archaeon]|nr:hypothetical protein [Candidatus Thermoplasmatota archaeon]